MIISCLSQKGGVGKSSLARTLSVEFTRNKWNVLLCDIDSKQSTSNRWNDKRRSDSNIQPAVETRTFNVTSKALEQLALYDLLVIDGAPHATSGTLEAALASDLIVLPTGTSIDDLETQIELANELIANDVNPSKIWFALYCVSSKSQEREALETLSQYSFNVFQETVAFSAGYINAFDSGFCATETRYSGLNERAAKLVQAIAKEVTNG